MTATTAADTGRSQGWVLPLSVLIVGTFMSVLDTSIVNVAIPTMTTALNASTDNIEWVVTGYTLALGTVVPLTGWLGLRIGQTRLYILGMLGFAVASALCGIAWNLSTMIIFRVIQAAVGPTLGGYLVEYIDWRLIYYINVPIGIVGAIAAFVVFPRIRPSSWPRLDIWGFLTVAYGLFAMLLAFSEGESWGWSGYRIMGLFVSSAISLALFAVIELEVDSPLIDLRIFKTGAYGLSLLLLSVAMTGLFSTLYFLPQFLQNIQGLQALDAGLVMVPSAAVLVVLMPIAGRLYDVIGPKIPVAIGLAAMAYGSYLLAQLTPDTPRADIELWTSIRNLGTGLAMMPIMTAGVSALAPALTPSGSGMNNVTQRVISSVAIAVFGGLNTTQAAQLMIDRSSLLTTGADALPQVAAAEVKGPSGLLGLYEQLETNVTTQTYDNSFYLVALISAAGALIALLLMRSRTPQGAAGAHAVEIEMPTRRSA